VRLQIWEAFAPPHISDTASFDAVYSAFGWRESLLQDRIQSYLYAGHFRKTERIFPMARQTVNRHIKALVERVGGAGFSISAHTFRHSFAIHLLLHGRPLKYVSQLLGHKSMDSTEIYTNVLTIDGGHFLEGVDFH